MCLWLGKQSVNFKKTESTIILVDYWYVKQK